LGFQLEKMMFTEYPIESKIIFRIKTARHISFDFDVQHAANTGNSI
jgi:hypothetical protein